MSYRYLPDGNRVVTNLNRTVKPSNTGGDAMLGQLNTTYYHGDQIGSTRMTTSGGGWPTTSDTFYPFGQEPPANAGPNHYQYAGLERDPETGLGHASFRQYSYGPVDVPRPLRRIDGPRKPAEPQPVWLCREQSAELYPSERACADL